MKSVHRTALGIGLLCICSVNVVLPISARAQDQPAPAQARDTQAPMQARRPRIGLALSGGGALGLAEIGVIQWMEENHIPVDRIAGTSRVSGEAAG